MPYSTKEKHAAWGRRYYERERERVLGIKKRWAERNPEKRAAHVAVGNAVRDGRLTKAPCAECGATPVQAHHDDYSKPLDVRWLCKSCHAALHWRL